MGVKSDWAEKCGSTRPLGQLLREDSSLPGKIPNFLRHHRKHRRDHLGPAELNFSIWISCQIPSLLGHFLATSLVVLVTWQLCSTFALGFTKFGAAGERTSVLSESRALHAKQTKRGRQVLNLQTVQTEHFVRSEHQHLDLSIICDIPRIQRGSRRLNWLNLHGRTEEWGSKNKEKQWTSMNINEPDGLDTLTLNRDTDCNWISGHIWTYHSHHAVEPCSRPSRIFSSQVVSWQKRKGEA
jgi:hypothetical protein